MVIWVMLILLLSNNALAVQQCKCQQERYGVIWMKACAASCGQIIAGT